uniref:Uncharacterized protein n=1 Tax=Lotus japonicus TaxID=34305 RepID=I3SLI6_LOTJA|nr:unknown [Lotus japonicus]
MNTHKPTYKPQKLIFKRINKGEKYKVNNPICKSYSYTYTWKKQE